MSTSRAPAPSMPEHVNTESAMTAQDAPSSLGPVPDLAPAISAPAAPARPAGSSLGQLVDETPDAMTLHTQDAYRMFTGRAADPIRTVRGAGYALDDRFGKVETGQAS